MDRFRCILCSLIVALCAVPLTVQAQTDVAASVYGAFGSTAQSSNFVVGITESPSNAAGVLLEVRHIMNPLVGFEGTYSYNRANQAYSSSLGGPSCAALGLPSCAKAVDVEIPANAHEITGDWVFSMKLANLRPFALAGGGILFTVPSEGTVPGTAIVCGSVTNECEPTSTTFTATRQTTGVFVYGAGIDWTLLPHLGLRFQYRGNLYKAPNLVEVFQSLDSFTHNSEPMAGVFFRF